MAVYEGEHDETGAPVYWIRLGVPDELVRVWFGEGSTVHAVPGPVIVSPWGNF